MARDYVGRKPAGNKRHSKKPTPPKRGFPVAAIVVLVVAIAAFVTVLWKINHSAKQPAPLPKAVVPKTAKPVTLKPLPKQPKAPDYITELENKQVTVKVPEQKKSTHQYQLQCASFRNREDAERFKAKVAFTGLSSQVKRSEGKSGVWFRVMLGPYPNRRAGDSDRHLLQRNGINGCQMWYWNNN
ncbi:SPOR domain-containing protein [Celerinatantimonas yamalensis]|uniref:SPOR domain-containing protein n=1 Tax=Celerinatantimonas yamalensis TaxID=559956 RepID=A0ABW9G8Y1_9GAMM